MLTSAPRSSVLSVKILDITITSPHRRVHIDIVRIDDIDNSKIVKDIHIPFEVTSDDELIKSSTPTHPCS